MASVAVSDGAVDAFPPGPHCFGEAFQDVHGGVPVDARVGDADALLQGLWAFGGDFLAAFVQVGFDHDADNTGFAGPDLVGDGLGYLGLVAVVLLGVALDGAC